MFWKIIIKDKYHVNLFCFLLVISFFWFGIISKLWTSISQSNVGNKYNLGISGVARIHMMTHTKREPRRGPQDPSLWRKAILDTIKSLSISDYYKIAFLHIEFNNSCFVKWNFIGWVSFFWVTFSNILLSDQDRQALHKESLQKQLCLTCFESPRRCGVWW